MSLFELVLIFALAGISSARPNNIGTQNVITVPSNCPGGQEWVNGECRDIWAKDSMDFRNVVTAPTNCPAGQEWINGACRDIWRIKDISSHNTVTAPSNCPAGQEWVNGQCGDILKSRISKSEISPANVVTVPPNCSVGQEYINGVCRDIWSKVNVVDIFEPIKRPLTSNIKKHTKNKRQVDEFDDNKIRVGNPEITNRNIISVPNQCPIGYKPDALGYCRPVFD